MAAGQTYNLKVNERQAGKHSARGLRTKGQVPAIVYGPKTKPISFSFSEIDATRYAKHGFENTIFTLTSDSKDLNGLKVLRKSIDVHPVSRRHVHWDFFAPDMTKKVRVDVELRFKGKAEGTKEGGIFTTLRRTVEIECLPLEIPEFFEVDISGLGLNQSLHVSDIQFPQGTHVITSMQETVATVSEIKEEIIQPTVSAEAATAEGAAAAAAGAAAPGAAAPAGAAPAADDKKAGGAAGGDNKK